MARRDLISIGVRLLTRNGHDWAARYPRIVEAVKALKVRSCLIDGEAVACDEWRGCVRTFAAREAHRQSGLLVELYTGRVDADRLRGPRAFEVRKSTLASLLRGCQPGLRLLRLPLHGWRVGTAYWTACRKWPNTFDLLELNGNDLGGEDHATAGCASGAEELVWTHSARISARA